MKRRDLFAGLASSCAVLEKRQLVALLDLAESDVDLVELAEQFGTGRPDEGLDEQEQQIKDNFAAAGDKKFDHGSVSSFAAPEVTGLLWEEAHGPPFDFDHDMICRHRRALVRLAKYIQETFPGEPYDPAENVANGVIRIIGNLQRERKAAYRLAEALQKDLEQVSRSGKAPEEVVMDSVRLRNEMARRWPEYAKDPTEKTADRALRLIDDLSKSDATGRGPGVHAT